LDLQNERIPRQNWRNVTSCLSVTISSWKIIPAKDVSLTYLVIWFVEFAVLSDIELLMSRFASLIHSGLQ